jgi:hypothetical protein
MISGLNLNAVHNFTIKEDKDNPTVWKIGILPSYVYAMVLDNCQGIDKLYKLVQFSLKGWENFDCEYKTEKIKFFGVEIDGLATSVLGAIPQDVVAKISMEIITLNKGLSLDEEKN